MSGFRSRNKPARRRSRNLKMSIEPVFQFRAEGEDYHRREGTLKPATSLLGRITGPITTINYPAYLQITPAFQDDGTPLDIKRGDLFVRLKYLDGEDTTDQDAIDLVMGTRAKHTLQAVSFEIRYNIFRILGDLA